MTAETIRLTKDERREIERKVAEYRRELIGRVIKEKQLKSNAFRTCRPIGRKDQLDWLKRRLEGQSFGHIGRVFDRRSAVVGEAISRLIRDNVKTPDHRTDAQNVTEPAKCDANHIGKQRTCG